MITEQRSLVRLGPAWLLAAAALLSSGGARAQLTGCAAGAVCYYVAVQPIDVCSSTGTGCAPFNTTSRTGNPLAATSTTPIGFVDATTGKDVTRAILNQIGLDIAWSPIKQYKNTLYQTLHVVTCPASGTSMGTITLPSGSTNPCTPGNLTSADFLQLSQQYSPNGINYTSPPGVPSPTNPIGVPVSPSPNMLNMFFVNTLSPPVPGTTLYGFSWPGNNGIAISANSFFPPIGVTTRFDNLAHEIGHNLGLDHTDIFNYGGTAPNSDLMTSGDKRLEPSSTSIALNDISTGQGAGSADQLTTDATTKPLPVTSNSQQERIAQSGFLNPIALSTTSASAPGTGDITTALIVSDTVGDLTTITAAPNSSKPNTSIDFYVRGPTGGRPRETLIGVTLTLGQGLHFDPTNRVTFFGTPPVTSFSYDHGNTGDANCPTPATQCLLVRLSGLPEGQFLSFSQGIVGAPGLVGSSGKTVSVNDIATAGASITFKFSDGLIITSALTPDCCGNLTADSQHPDPALASQIDPILFTGTPGAPPCTPPPPVQILAANVAAATVCPDPVVTGGSDGNPSEEPQPLTTNPG